MAKVNDVSLQTGFPMPNLTSRPQSEGEGNGFSDIMQKARKAGEEAAEDLMNLPGRQSPESTARRTEQLQRSESGKAENAKADVKSEESEKSKAPEKTKAEQKSDAAAEAEGEAKEAPEVDAAKVAKAEEQVLQEVAAELDITTEELIAAMEVLGLTAADLGQPGNLAELLGQIREVGQADIVMSEELTDLVQGVSAQASQTLQEAAAELGISPGQLAEEIEKLQQMPAEEVMTVADSKAGIVAETTPEEPGLMQEIAKAPAEGGIQKEQAAGAEDTDEAAVEAEPGEMQPVKAESEVSQQAEPGRDNKRREHPRGDENRARTEAAQAPVQTAGEPQTIVESRAVADRLEESFDAARTRQIIDQIAEHVRVNQSDKSTGIEMMLNPANLGSIKLQLESENGVIRGQLTASDEAVRAALESQLAQLRDALVEQGMKVDAIEVTVAEHKMEENRDQEGRRDEQQAEEQAGSVRSLRSNRRILDLNEVDEAQEAGMTDAERLEVEMMRMGGNRLNLNV